MRISLPLVALLLVGCSGTEPDFIYTSKQAEQVNKQIEDLTAKPIQKYISNVDLTDEDQSKLRESIPLIDQMIAWDPVTLNGYALKGKIQLALGDPTSAKETFVDGIAKSVVKEEELDKTIRSEVYIDLATIEYAANNLKSAEAALNSAIKFSDTAPQAHVLLGRIYQRTDRLAEAKEESLKALLLNADYEPARIFYREVNANPKVSP